MTPSMSTRSGSTASTPPSRSRPSARSPATACAEITKGKPGRVQAGKRNKYGRIIARIEVEGQDVNRQMVAEGLPWQYTAYSDDATLAEAH
jgi:endonuclease YncB( thermonuclease family)